MEWIIDNWIIVLIPLLLLVMYFFGFGCGHGKNKQSDCDEHNLNEDAGKSGKGGCCH